MPNPTANELLDKVKEAGYPKEQLAELAAQVELLRYAQELSGIDVDALAADTLKRLPELRRGRAAVLGKEVATGKDFRGATLNNHDRQTKKEQVERLEKSAEKLASPDADERFRARAFATEFAIVVESQIRGVTKNIDVVEPDLLGRFNGAHARMRAHLQKMEGYTPEQALIVVNKRLLESVGEAKKEGRTLAAGLEAFVDGITQEIGAASGHLNDVSVDRYWDEGDGETRLRTPHSLKTGDDVTVEATTSALQERAAEERAMEAQQHTLAEGLNRAAAYNMNIREYAIFRTMLDYDHLFDWKIDKDTQEVSIRRKKGAEIGATPPAVLREALPNVYSGDGAARRAIHQMTDRLAATLREGKEIQLTPEVQRRMALSTPDAQREGARTDKKQKRGMDIE